MTLGADIIPLPIYPAWIDELVAMVEYTGECEEEYNLHWTVARDNEDWWVVTIRPFSVERGGKLAAPKIVSVSIDLPFTEKLSEMSLSSTTEGLRISAKTQEGDCIAIDAYTIPEGFRMNAVRGRTE